jgi:hypothetical protein
MTVKQADAINSKLQNMQIELDSLKKLVEIKNAAVRLALKYNKACDSLEERFTEMSYGPTFIYNYKNDIYTIDLSLFKIKLNSMGKVKLKKMNRWEIGRYFELLHGNSNGLTDWKETFREFDLPLIEDNKILFDKK